MFSNLQEWSFYFELIIKQHQTLTMNCSKVYQASSRLIFRFSNSLPWRFLSCSWATNIFFRPIFDPFSQIFPAICCSFDPTTGYSAALGSLSGIWAESANKKLSAIDEFKPRSFCCYSAPSYRSVWILCCARSSYLVAQVLLKSLSFQVGMLIIKLCNYSVC